MNETNITLHLQTICHFHSPNMVVVSCNAYRSFGDSGGPLIVYSRDGQPLLAGIASTGVGCDTARFPAVYTKVGGAVSEWVRKEVPEVKC